ncbi:histidinol dehydrogenase [Aestuariivirga sp. YIM B02566]|uniref:Histidinol dehydrogenase n=1 Tax=Taklimakanibacter albus TaxID=2800327 RepID=A0ACC5R2Q3_9HYPH|nr:histidinol dehydrogenase [Aestuariivirga sp. YIM B02566]MBK1866937.1 histidinol dehydrogenase [Aestuariivirga sp. YIM B02566]
MTAAVNFVRLDGLSAEERRRCLARTESDLRPYLEKVAPIIDAVAAEGDEAVARFTRQFDKAPVAADDLAATPDDFVRARKSLKPDITEAIAFAAHNITKFHQRQKPEEMWLTEIAPGAFAGDRIGPIASVACYVPRGKGSFPSSVMMTCIPAKVAGVDKIAIVTPPGPDGSIDAATLVAAEAAGVSQVFKCGGAQAVAAVAYGTRTIPRCAKIVGPGSPWVVAAKRLVADRIDTGTPAGPSESIIFADETVDGRLAALDLLIEAEHGADSSAWLVTHVPAVAEAARAVLPELLKEMSLERAGFAEAVLKGPQGGILLCPDAESAIAFVNDYAPEHLQILSLDPKAWLASFKNAGEILLGEYTPSTLGNFVLGPNHVLPTGGWARTASPLSVFDFMKRTSIGHVTREGYDALARQARVIANYEGFDAHANAVSDLRTKFLRVK